MSPKEICQYLKQKKWAASITLLGMGVVVFLQLMSQQEQGRKSSVAVPELVLLTAPVGRSGSTWLGEMLSLMHPSGVYFYEPEYMLTKEGSPLIPEESAMSLVTDLFNCSISNEFVEWLKTRPDIHTVYRHTYTSRVCRPFDWKCLQTEDLTRLCRETRYRVIKTIRLRLSWVYRLLSDPRLRLKVVFLIRDPRASIASRKRFGWKEGARELCPRIEEDLKHVAELQRLFPETFLLVKFEDACWQPRAVALNLHRFLTSDPDSPLPEIWRAYLERTTSKGEAEAWRTEIDEVTLEEVQEYCGKVIDYLVYKNFSCVDEMRNLSVPLLR